MDVPFVVCLKTLQSFQFFVDVFGVVTELVSINQAGTESGNSFSGGNPVLSADGRFVVFWSFASDLVATDTNGESDVFVRDLQTGTTTLVSVNRTGTDSGNDFSSFNPVISADGRFVAFTSFASDLVATDSNGVNDVFVRDLQTGTTTLASVNRAGTDSGHNGSFDPVISADGRFVAFLSRATDLVATDTNGIPNVFVNVFVRDVLMGTTTLASVNRTGTNGGNDNSFLPALSADGRFLAFGSDASDLVVTDTNGRADMFVRDLQKRTTTLASVNRGGTDSANSGSFGSPALSADGRFVAFTSTASDLVATDTNGESDVFVRDLQTGTITLVSVNGAGTDSGNRGSSSPLLSADGRFVAFGSIASDLVATDTNGNQDVFVRNLQTGTTTLVSVNRAGTDSGNNGSFDPVISADGRFVAFFSEASDLVATDTNGSLDVFVRNLQKGTTTLVSVNRAGTDSINGSSFGSFALSADGRFVAFLSDATDLVATDTSGTANVFVRPVQRGVR